MKIVLIGGGGHASDVLTLIEDIQATPATRSVPPGESIEVVGFVDDQDVDLTRFRSRGVARVGTLDHLGSIDATHYVIAAGWPASRMAMMEAAPRNLVPATLVHPSAAVGRGVTIGPGSVVFSGTVLSAMVEVGRHCLISHNAVVGHDSTVGDFSSIMPAAVLSGETRVGVGATIGTNATVVEGVSIGDRVTVGAGAVVIRSVGDEETVVGVPARPR